MTLASRHSEAAFETVIEHHLLAHGYVAAAGDGFDQERAHFPHVVLDFIKDTQPREWAKLEALLGPKTGEQILADLCKWMDANGSLATLRHGFKCYGRTLHVAFFKAAHELNPELEARYARNRLGLTRQLRFSARSSESLDVTLSVNGIPVATLELKNPMTGQNVEDARRQYKQDRDPREPIFEFKRRTLVHFAVDTEAVLMTTRLAGSATHFLPFNKGKGGGAGNPADPHGRAYRTAYLWEEVLARDSLLDLLARFLHLQEDEKRDDQGRKVKIEQLVFPRYHQLQAVRLLVDAARTEGPGHNYLVEHSAGSGKSNTIAWLAHRLASLHDASNARVFDSVIVVTDRVVLDQQLQDNIYQFEHKRGVVQKVDEGSRQLAEALESAVPIIVTTLQKFPFVSRQLLKMAEERGEAGSGTLQTRRCAVVVDEAHSSQGGENATDLKEVLGGEALRTEARRRAAEEGREDLEELFRSMAKRGRQANLSFFAFTATPKHKTLAVFGRDGQPAHRYTMRQAIEEGFILDVLRSYTSYATYFRLLKACEDDPNVERKKAARALARFLRLHPHNIAQKTEVMVEHFHAVTRHKIGGRAKAMVVTGSRLEAVRYKQSFDRYIKEKGYPIKSLVAFSGTVQDDKLPEVSYTEEAMNGGLREKELPERFAAAEYQVLLVAEKYQTGFDQPLLHTMYVDKRLAGIQAVQTLSRLNRIHPLKEDTFVLDFVNDREEIREAFKTYYEGAEIGEEVDPARLYAIKGELDQAGIYLEEEVARFCEVYFKPKQRQSVLDHQAMNAALDPAVSRFAARAEESPDEAELWRGKLQAFQNLYGYLSQVIPYQDSDLERLYVFLRHLATKLPRRAGGAGYQFDDEVKLEYYRLQKISEGSITLAGGEAPKLDGPSEVGSGLLREQPVPLSQLIDIVNDRFGTDFNQADQLFFDQIVEAAMGDDDLRRAAAVNSGDKFELVFRNVLERLFVDRMDQNEDIFVRFMNDPAFQKIVTTWMAEEAYRRLRASEGSQRASSSKLRLVEGASSERYVTCVPLVSLKAAAGPFGVPQHVSEGELEWVEVGGERQLRPGMFVAQVIGRSMEPRIADGSYCLFAAPVVGSRQGRTVLVQLRDSIRPRDGAPVHGEALRQREGARRRLVAAYEDHPEADEPRLRAHRARRRRGGPGPSDRRARRGSRNRGARQVVTVTRSAFDRLRPSGALASVPQRRRPRGLPHALQDLVHPDRLRDVALGAEELGLPLEAVGGEDQDRHGGALRVPAHPLHHAPAVEDGHLEVEEDDAGGLLGHLRERDLAVVGHLHGIAGVGEDLRERLAEVVVVVDDQDVLAGRHAGPPRKVLTISAAIRRASASAPAGSVTAPTTGWPPPPYRSQMREMSWTRRWRAQGLEPTDTFVRFGSRDTTTVYAASGKRSYAMNLFAASTAVSPRSISTTPSTTRACARTTSIAPRCFSRMGASGSVTQGSAAMAASGLRCIASMSRVGSAASFVASRSVMIRRAGSASSTAVRGESKRAASMMSAHRSRSARSSARQSNRSARTRAMKPVLLGAAGSQNLWPERSASKAARSAGVGKALAWWSNHQ